MQTKTDYDYLFPGDVLLTYCSKHRQETNHVWTGHLLVCLLCAPETINEIPSDEHHTG